MQRWATQQLPQKLDSDHIYYIQYNEQRATWSSPWSWPSCCRSVWLQMTPSKNYEQIWITWWTTILSWPWWVTSCELPSHFWIMMVDVQSRSVALCYASAVPSILIICFCAQQVHGNMTFPKFNLINVVSDDLLFLSSLVLLLIQDKMVLWCSVGATVWPSDASEGSDGPIIVMEGYSTLVHLCMPAWEDSHVRLSVPVQSHCQRFISNSFSSHLQKPVPFWEIALELSEYVTVLCTLSSRH